MFILGLNLGWAAMNRPTVYTYNKYFQANKFSSSTKHSGLFFPHSSTLQEVILQDSIVYFLTWNISLLFQITSWSDFSPIH